MEILKNHSQPQCLFYKLKIHITQSVLLNVHKTILYERLSLFKSKISHLYFIYVNISFVLVVRLFLVQFGKVQYSMSNFIV